LTDQRIPRLKPCTRQWEHGAALFVMMLLLHLVLSRYGTDWWWSLLAFLSAAAHQGLVAFIWRREIFAPARNESKRRWTIRFFAVSFALLIAFRIALTVILSGTSSGSIALNPFLRIVGMGGILFFALWTFYSVIRYFGMFRALGADHFLPEYRLKPFVRKGIYQYTSNAMYTFGTLPFLLPGLLLQSGEALAFGLYQYLAVWIHYWATEKPDIRHLYGKE
jgi:hypothetical protein